MSSSELSPPTPESPAPLPPVAERRPVSRSLWGETVVDDYGWLRQSEDQAVLDHLEAENVYTEAVLAPVAELRETLFEEIRSRIKETDLSVPVVKDGWAYYSRTEQGRAYPTHCRKRVAPDATDVDLDLSGDEVVLLDENLEAADDAFFDVGPFDISPDHQLLFWGWDRTGDERYTATFRNLETGEELPDRLEDVSTSSAWALDNRTLFYVKPDEANRPYQVWRHVIGTEQDEDELIYTEEDERFFVGVGLEKDDSFIQIGSSSKITDEVRVVPAADPMAAPRLVAERRDGVEYAVAHRGRSFVILTNEGGVTNFRVMLAPDDSTGSEHWDALDVSGDGSEEVMISDIDVFEDHLVLFERVDGLTRIRVRRWSDGHLMTIAQRESTSTVWPGANPDFGSDRLRYGYGSMVTPASVYSLDLGTGERTLLKRQEVPGDFDPDRYSTDRVWASAPDGTSVPVSLVWAKDRASEPGPCLLYAYGAYEASIDPTFSPARLSLLDRGFVFAIAHVRGGGEMGRSWYLDGKFEAKANTFDDLVAVAAHLIDEGWTTPDRLVLRGGSAGGLTVGTAVNRAPELFAAVVGQVAFVDVLNTMLDASLPLTVTEWEEWGNPESDEAIYRAMRAYCPYENVGAKPYPSVLATGGLHDTRVGYWEPVKWVQVLREHTTSDREILSWTDLGAGHGGPTDRYDSWREEARLLAYIVWAVGLST